MGLINVPDLTDGTGADANDINSRVATILALLNGNIDSTNIKINSITSSNFAPSSVVNDKMVDNNINSSRIDRNSIPWGIAVFSQPTTGQTIAAGATAQIVFDTLEANNHAGVTMATPGILKVASAGVYSLTASGEVIDTPQTNQALIIQFSVDGTNWVNANPFQPVYGANANGRGVTVSVNLYLVANSSVRALWYNGGNSNTKIGSADAKNKYNSSLSTLRVA